MTDVHPLTGAEARALEPALSPAVRAGFRVPGEHLIDPWSAAHGYLLQALANGAVLMRQAEVLAGRRAGDHWHLATTAGDVTAGLVINAAGLWGDEVDRRVTGESWFTIKPRKGQFVVYDKTAAALAGHILLPVPTKITKGIVVCRTAFGNLLVGPTAEEQDDREHATVDRATLQALMRRGAKILPALAGHEVTAVYAGLRPATEAKEYRIRTDLAPGLHLCRRHPLHRPFGGPWNCRACRPAGRAQLIRRWPIRSGRRCPTSRSTARATGKCPGHGGVVCHCELVTRREIEAALTGPMAAGSLAGLKRRTRVTMGRCQGFYCSAELARMTEGRLAQPMLEPADD